jgi:2-C-methyl-D-erythritol 2,4-cyclodiphosphate synthase
MMQREGYSLVNVDATLLLEAPKMKPHRQAMIASVAEVLVCKTSQVSIKATTVEKMGAIGRGEGLAAQVVVLLQAI